MQRFTQQGWATLGGRPIDRLSGPQFGPVFNPPASWIRGRNDYRATLLAAAGLRRMGLPPELIRQILRGPRAFNGRAWAARNRRWTRTWHGPYNR